MIRFKEYLERRARRAAFMSVCLAGLAGFGGLFLGSCANEDLGKDNDKNGGDKGAAVSFNVSEAQDDAQAAAKAMPGVPVTRAAFSEQLGMMNLTPADLTTQKLAVQGAAGADLCLIETTTPGVNPMRQDNRTMTARTAATTGKEDTEAATRANITTMTTLGHFASYGYRGTTAAGISAAPSWFYHEKTNPDGTLVSPRFWSWQIPFGRFYAVSPWVESGYAKLQFSPATHAGTPYVDFEVEPDVKNQKDLMTACSGVVQYATQFVPPTTNLKFRHALTAVCFKVGQNLSWNKTITKVEIIGAMGKGRYTLSPDETGTGAAWSNLSAPQTFTLGGDGTVNVSTTAAVNNIIMGKNNDNYTFYMIPQPLSGVQVKIYFDNSSTPAITANLSGTWKPGTTKTYALSQNNSDWQYQLTVTSPAAVEYNATTTGNYTIQSYRKDPATNTLQKVAWKVVGYSTDNGLTWSDNKPVWFTGLTKENGAGSTDPSGETGQATLQPEAFCDKLALMNAALKQNPKGSSTDYYDLSIHNIKGVTIPRSTANCYIISHPGYYKIPLVYGNAIKNGAINTNSYISQAPTGTPNELLILRHFKDHVGQNITDPWIEKTNSGANNGVDGAKLVWADTPNLVHFGSNKIVRGGGETFVQFEVKASDIQNGNAVIAVMKNNVVVWSWHLWFIYDDALNSITCTNFQGKDYAFTEESLGMKYTIWNGTSYASPRSVKVKVEQETPNGGIKQEGFLTITQNPSNVRQGFTTLYQWGRKDAFPGTDANLSGTFNRSAGDNMSIPNNIQHPENYYTNGSSWNNMPPAGYTWCNLWSANSTTTDYNDNPVVKTVYDPCPAGFKLPASNAFTGFNKTGSNTGIETDFNITSTWSYGWNFNNRITAPDASVYFPASGLRYETNGSLHDMGSIGCYWSAVAFSMGSGNLLVFGQSLVFPLRDVSRPTGCSARPVAE